MMMIVVQSLSIVSCLFVVILYFWLEDLRQFTFRLVAYLATADILKGIGMLLPPDDATMCMIQAIINVYFEFCSFLWVAVISYVMLNVIVHRDIDIQRKETKFLLFCSLLPLFASVLPAILGNYGYAEGWCFIADSGGGFVEGTVTRVIVFYLPLYIVLIYCGYIYHQVHKEIAEHTRVTSTHDTSFSERRSILYKLYLYPVVLFFSYALVTVYRIYNFSTDGAQNFPLAFVSAFFMSMNGLLNALVYGLTKNVRLALVAKLRGREAADTDDFNFSILSHDSGSEVNVMTYKNNPKV
mmetsp:Transcript_22616/g.40711  ORF Transcript_22616/g.40711 Transcript_22616/m.40711 type:complete len:297 (-) Transcript_22616:58-948(-)